MDSENSGTKSEKLTDLAERLRSYNLLPDDPQIITAQSADSNGGSSPWKKKSNRAAVLICLFEGEEGGELRVILTKRSSTLSTHSGEVALPGGKREEGDEDDVRTALREAQEEIGLDPSLVDVVAVLKPVVNKRGMIVVPVIGILWDKKAFHPVLNLAEVESIFDSPLEMFLKDENRREVEKEWEGNKYLLHFFDYEVGETSYLIWALTAGILITAASLVYQRPPDFVEMKPIFWDFAHISRY